MALLWSKHSGGTRYEVRTAGNSLRLYTDGVFHSQYNPARPVTGSVWDLLFLPAFFYPPGHIRRVLVLGVGGGAVIRQLRHFVEPAEIIGVELSATHLMLARKFFGLRAKNTRLVQADAMRWIADYRGAKFDLIIDDLFGEEDGQPVRVAPVDGRWFNRLERHLTPGGAVVSNFVSGRTLNRCAYFTDAAFRRKIAAAFRLTTPVTENAVAVFLKSAANPSELRHRLNSQPELARALNSGRLRYHIRRLTK